MIDSTGSVIYAALNGLAARQRVIANNVANVETPGFIAGRVSFEDSLREAIAGDALLHRALAHAGRQHQPVP